jgi:hypothetical protein
MAAERLNSPPSRGNWFACGSPKFHLSGRRLILSNEAATLPAFMLNAILSLFRMIPLILGGYGQVALENLALREQLATFQRSVRRPKIRPTDQLFWVCLRKVWKEWKSALVIVRPETVLACKGSVCDVTGPDYHSTRIHAGLGPTPTSENW